MCQISLQNPNVGSFFHIAHTHPLDGVDVPFGDYDLLTIFLATSFVKIYLIYIDFNICVIFGKTMPDI